jgi:hypothetical protein
MSDGPLDLVLANEFAAVRLDLDYEANVVRLRITDLERGTSICLDPFQLASLTVATVTDFDRLAAPD